MLNFFGFLLAPHPGYRGTVNLAIGQITPPVAVNLYVAAQVGNATLDEISGNVWPLVGFMVLALLIIASFPSLSLLLPGILKLK